jgi:hypothetical protein
MGGFQFDRKSYMGGQVPPLPPPPGHLQERITFAVAVVAILGAGYAAYRILGSSPAPVLGKDTAEQARSAAKLDMLEHRLDAMEEKLNAPPTPAAAPAPAPAPVKKKVVHADPPPSAPATPVRVRVLQAPKPESPPSVPPQPSPDLNALRQEREQALSSLRSDVAANRQEWVATADRLGNVVGELNSQHQEIVRHQETLEQLEEHFERDSVPFTLRKDGAKQQVGPVRLLLESTDTKNSRYTMRLFFGDRWIELKDRALHEAIQFYDPEGELALELMVSRIAKEAVVGRLALPPRTNASR